MEEFWGIKEIAKYLSLSEAAVIYKHRDEGLPYLLRKRGQNPIMRAWTTRALIDNWLLAKSRAHSDLLRAKRAKRAELTAHAKEKDQGLHEASMPKLMEIRNEPAQGHNKPY